jgi:hypothetical protein
MFTRYSKDGGPSSAGARFVLLVLIITATGVIPCQNSLAVVISKDFDLPIPSPDAPDIIDGKGPMEDAIIDVDKHFLIEDLDVAITLTHEAFFDLEIALESPTGTTITLNPPFNYAFIIQDDNGSHSAGGQNRFLFDDEAAIDIEHATQPFDQPFRPAIGFELSAFDGQDVFGSWRLKINDLWALHTGQLDRVELIINIPEPTTASLFALAAVVNRLLRSRRPRG